jgi:hypothetical protein
VWISRTTWGALAAAVGIGLAHCAAPTNCLRYSDCSDGLTCAAGKCVPPPASIPDAGLDVDPVATADGETATEPDAGATSDDATPGVVEAGVDVAEAGDDAATAGDGAAADATGE